MSRTYRKTVAYKDGRPAYLRWAKRQASKRARRAMGLSDGGQYRRVYNTYNIHDYVLCLYTQRGIEDWSKGCDHIEVEKRLLQSERKKLIDKKRILRFKENKNNGG